ncbi:ATP-binding protein [Ferrovum sp.]|uniref:ATP-binding protein n=1 Tax=Ferrovum sp. TaxID=2609467 RepID=UPI0026315ABD|nr:ATP-binding protein [Ferrovum sp.]
MRSGHDNQNERSRSPEYAHTTLTQLRQLKLDGLAIALEEQLGQPGMTAMSFEERMALLIDREVHHRNDKKLLRLLKNARLKYGQATLGSVSIFLSCPLLFFGHYRPSKIQGLHFVPCANFRVRLYFSWLPCTSLF